MRRSLEAQLPSLPKLDAAMLNLAAKAQSRFREETITRRDVALNMLHENQRVLAEASQDRIANLTNEIQTVSLTVDSERQNHRDAKGSIMVRHGLRGWSMKTNGRSHIKFRLGDGSSGFVYKESRYQYGNGLHVTKCSDWDR